MIIKPRLNDLYDIPLTQEEVDFVIPRMEDDIPLYVDPFLLWKSPSQQDNSLHTEMLRSFNKLGYEFTKDKKDTAVNILKELSECTEVGLGTAKTKKGHHIGDESANTILSLFTNIPQINTAGFKHFEEIQLLVNGISKDRISDFTCNLLKSFLIDYTIYHAEKYKIPLFNCNDVRVYDSKTNKIRNENITLPQNPETKAPILFIPKRWLRYIPWINYEDYFDSFYIKNIDQKIEKGELGRIKILDFNRENYGMVETYTKNKELEQADCKNDPLFKQIPILSAKRILSDIRKLPSGKTDNADKKYEDLIVKLMSSILYPHLDFADAQSRTDSGAQIRDLIFYNNKSYPFLQEIYNEYESKQIVMEIKNVAEVEREHVNQINRYMTDSLGRFGIIITRNKIKDSLQKNIIDLWSGQRRCILVLTDVDIAMMVDIFENKQRLPIEVIKKCYIEFRRKCPS